MAIGIWDDFTEKHGFQDGEAIEETDFVARTILVKTLNTHPLMKEARLRVVPYDVATVHNPCTLAVLPYKDKESDKQLLEAWDKGEIQLAQLPEELQDEITAIIRDAYRETARPPRMRRLRKK